jgi:hypothetical protein
VRKASSRRLLAFAVASLVHLVLFSALVLGRRPDPAFVEPPAFDVQLVAPPPRALAPRPLRRRQVEATVAPVVLPQLKPTPEVSEADRAALMAAPFVGFPGAGAILRARKSCLNGAATEGEMDECVRLFGKGPVLVTAPEDPTGEFARAARRKDQIRTYKDSKDFQSFPGLRCSFGAPCDAKPFDGPEPGGPMRRR